MLTTVLLNETVYIEKTKTCIALMSHVEGFEVFSTQKMHV